ncbi:MAG: TetR/AcrR family transcriptional regulator [bacterium]|nr:TetR/AcrR family transcriptional regulator [bacterium]
MPRKCKFSSKDIIDAAFSVVRKLGWDRLSANSIADELQSSTMPIYSYLKSMKNLEEEIIKKAVSLLIQYQSVSRTGDPFLDMGTGYILFAREEPNLYHCLNDGQRFDLKRLHETYNFDTLPHSLSSFPLMNGISKKQERKVLFTIWVLFHGIAVLINSSLKNTTEHEIISFLRDTGITLWKGFASIIEEEQVSGNPFYAFEGIIRTVEIELNSDAANTQTGRWGISVNRVGVRNWGEGIFIR